MNIFTSILGVLAMSGIMIPGEIYAWTVVFLLPVNSALNPVLYTLSSFKMKVSHSHPYPHPLYPGATYHHQHYHHHGHCFHCKLHHYYLNCNRIHYHHHHHNGHHNSIYQYKGSGVYLGEIMLHN